MSFVFPFLLVATTAALFFAAHRCGVRGALIAAGVPFALLGWLWLALKFYWIDHTGDDDAEVILYLIVIWLAFSSVVSTLGLAFRKRR